MPCDTMQFGFSGIIPTGFAAPNILTEPHVSNPSAQHIVLVKKKKKNLVSCNTALVLFQVF